MTPSAGHRAGEGLSSSRRHHRYVPSPIHRGVPHGFISRIYTASVAFALMEGARHSLIPTQRRVTLTTPRLRFMLRTAPSLPLYRAFDAGLQRRTFPPTLPACYRASWQLPGPDSHRQTTTNLRTQDQLHEITASPPVLLDALHILHNWGSTVVHCHARVA
jgi:hypothetical protein